MSTLPKLTAEEKRLEENRDKKAYWERWGPYLSERQWGTVREDYSPYGTAWEYLPHDHARSRAYRWGEDGIAGITDNHERLCFSVAFWNGKDPILKERLFGLTGNEGNHGEDVKEYYYFLDNTPSHAYMKCLYKYPQAAYPYNDLVWTNMKRSRMESEYELIDTGIFDGDRYFDVFVEYAKGTPEDILIKITAVNHGPEETALHLLPTLWFRNTWSWDGDAKPIIRDAGNGNGVKVVEADHATLGKRWLYCDASPKLLFTENETNFERLFGVPSASPYVKDGINDYVVSGKESAVNPGGTGTKTAVHYVLTVPPGKSVTIKLRLTDEPGMQAPFGTDFDNIFQDRINEADEFYARISPHEMPEDLRNVQRQAFAGILLCYKRLDEGRPGLPSPTGGEKDGEGLQVDTPIQRRRALDARHVGVSVVRSVGPRVSYCEHGGDRSRVRQEPVDPPYEGMVHASERPDTCI